ncbi:hypothetical protein FWH30_01855 [Microgenomates group bacterium]|nr:hypothetical protein [Microgenomates group bacterium]
MLVERVIIGGWFQRTTLHLSEIFDFLRYGTSQLKLDAGKLKKFQEDLRLTGVEYKIYGMEFLRVTTAEKINIDVYEDGLIILYTSEAMEIDRNTLGENLKFLTEFYEQRFSPALTYLFSTGAPVPKELANIKTVYPYFFVFDNAPKQEVLDLLSSIEQEKYLEEDNENYDLFRGDRFYLINRQKISLETTRSFIEEQIFLREFKAQLHRYLNIHRIIWEKIDMIREKKVIKGKDIAQVRHQIEGYAKTINLIGARMNQMGSYLATREKSVMEDPDLALFMDVVDYRFEALANTLSYTKDLWRMTENHVSSSLHLLDNLQQEMTSKSIENLTVITVIGVGTSVMWFLGLAESMPQLNLFSILFLVGLVVLGYVSSWLVKWHANRTSYEYNDADYDKDIK